MSDKFRIDSHKLLYHPKRVSDWMSGKIIYPLYMELSPSGICNHRCEFCGLDFMEYQKRFLKTDILKERLTEMGRLGVKSIMYGGEGEPFLHPDMVDIILHTKASGIDVAMTTNGALFSPAKSEPTLGAMQWVKVSIAAGSAPTYAKLHNTKEADFDRVIENMSHAARYKAANGLGCTLGMQMLLLPDNRYEAVELARIASQIGMDYLVIKPYSQHPQSKTRHYSEITYADALKLEDELKELNTDSFSVIFRARAMQKWDDSKRPYSKCLALPFWSYIDAGGDVWGCSVFLRDERFCYGNIYENTFKEIWEGRRRLDSLKWVETEMDASNCRVNCRMDEINRYLWELKNPSAHVNFI